MIVLTNDEIKKIGQAEMRHAETIAEQLFYLGGQLTTQPVPIFVGATLKAIINRDINCEANAIKLYKTILETTRKEDDEVTNLRFCHILEDEENDHDFFISIAEEM